MKKSKERVRLLLNGERKLIIDDTKKAKLCNAFLASVFTKKVNFDQMASGIGIKNKS